MALEHQALHPHIAGLQGYIDRAGPTFHLGVRAEMYMYIQRAFQDAVYVAQSLTM